MIGNRLIKPRRPGKTGRPEARPALEPLEDRTLLSLQPVTFTLEPASSVLTLSGTAQGTTLQPQAAGSLTTHYSGTLATMLDPDNPQTIAFQAPGTALTAANSGSWQPAPGGAAGSAPAAYGAFWFTGGEFSRPLNLAYRNLTAALTSATLGLSRIGLTSSYSVPSTQTLRLLSGSADYRITSPVFPTDSGTANLTGSAGSNGAASGTLQNLGLGSFRLTLPIDVTLSSSLAGQPGASRLNGTLVANVTIPYVQVNLTGGVLQVTGNNAGNTITLDHTGSVTVVQGLQFPDSQINRIQISTGDGTNVINITATARPVTVNGGAGNNYFHLGGGPGGLAAVQSTVYIYRPLSGGGSCSDFLCADDCGCQRAITYLVREDATNITISKVIQSDGHSEPLIEDHNDNACMYTVGFVAGENPADVVNVESTAANVVTYLDTCVDDTVNIGNTMHGVQDILGPVHINNDDRPPPGPWSRPHPGRSYLSKLNVNDSGDPGAPTATLSPSGPMGQIAGLAPAPIDYTVSSLSALTVITGGGDDTVTVQSTASHIPVLLDSSGGNDTVNVGDGTHGVQDINGELTVQNGAGVDTLNVNDSGNGTGRNALFLVDTVTGTGIIASLAAVQIAYQVDELSALNVTGGSGANLFRVLDTGQGVHNLVTTLNTGSGNSTVSVQATTGALVVHGGAAGAKLVGASPSPQTWNITGANAGTLRGANFATDISFTAVGNLTGGANDDTFLFNDGAAVSGKIDGGGGVNTLDYSAYASTVIVDLPLQQATGVFGFAPYGLANIQNAIGGSGGPASGPGAPYNILVGAEGNVLTGGDGRRNLLIAGVTASTLQGGNDDDILIGGTTAWDLDLVALRAVMAEWTSTASYSVRADHLTNGGGLVGPYLLNGFTVSGNGGGNTLIGHHGADSGLNLYYGSAADLALADGAPPEIYSPV
jgi:hypothetical protein